MVLFLFFNTALRICDSRSSEVLIFCQIIVGLCYYQRQMSVLCLACMLKGNREAYECAKMWCSSDKMTLIMPKGDAKHYCIH